ncbi:hypothetical protein TGAM01_v210211 [Trichoderma gamsii]|uniref:Mitochondrial division protein 1 n=1 Tax=Trichoderma gamsii TaxID=398673 RepID=A0A2P4Z9I1_9HYPO|nr:hypothetical protein TGAM01_v210211 [Trichoderma gamsii]PON20926.1 hypothetical protein TGAM01_v210211 [Trichoderma gamsii]
MPIRQRFRNIFSRNTDVPAPDGLSKEDGSPKQDSLQQLTTISPANILVSYMPDASLPERLWDQAYDALKIQDAALVQAYEKILSRHLHGQGLNSPVMDADKNVIAQDNAHTRRTQMRRLIDEGLNNTAQEAKLKETIGTATQFIFAAKDIISSAIQATPQAALAWAGVCVALEMIQNPIASTEANRIGIEYVIKRMDWYWNLSSIILKESPNDNDGGFGSIRRELETQVVDLYKALLLYEIKSVCFYYRSRGLVLLRDIAKLDDWNGDIRAIQNAERIFNDGSNTLVDLKKVSNLEQLVKYAEMQSTTQMTREDQQCMKDLRLTDPSADKKRIEQTKGGLLHDAYSWILNNPDYQHWRNNKESRLLWIKGDPGKGKTMLLCGIINELDQHSIGSGTAHVIYFFCQATDNQLNNAAAVLRGLIFMLINKQPSLISHLRKEYDQAGGKLFEGSNTWIALSDILAAILQDPTLKATYLVVDALDECTSDLQKLLDMIVDTSSTSSRVKWIVSSRNWSQIEERLRRAEQKAKLSLELNADSVSNAVDVYIRERVHRLAILKGYDEETCDAIRTYLSDNANDTFLWVALVCQNLEKYQRWKVLRMLGEFPLGLDSLYRQMTNQVLSMNDASDVSLCKRILAIMTSVYRPITLRELGRLIDIPGNLSDDINFLEEIVALCGSFLTIRDDTIYFVHQSAKDHLTSNEEAVSAIFPSGSEDTHLGIFFQSIQAMEAILRTNIYQLSHFDNFISNDINLPDPDPLSPIDYSCLYWVKHLCEGIASKISTEYQNTLADNGALDVFVRKHLLHWLESLSLLRHVSDAVISITKLVALLTARSTQGKLVTFLQDAHRFLLYNKRAIEIAPLQVYSAALLFSPMKSLIREAFLHETPSWIYSRPINEDQWSPCLQTLEGHQGPVMSLIYLDNNQIAAASMDGTIKIWDVITGTCLRSPAGIEGFSALISLKNGRLASDSKGGIIQIWDPTTGDERIATGLKSGKIKIWDLNAGICIQTLEGHNGSIQALDSYGDDRIISGSSDKTVRIWDISTGECIQTLTGHTGVVRSVAYSTDGQIASASGDCTIKIWDAATGECVQTLTGHESGVFSVAYSTDGQIASTSGDNTIKIWDAATGVCTRTLKGHSGTSLTVAFLDNGQLASSSIDMTIKIWDLHATANVEARTSGYHDRPVRSLAVSEDGRIASGSEDGTMRIWDIAGKCVQILERHASGISAIDFSKDGRLVISCSFGGAIKVLDADTGLCVKTLETSSEEYTLSVMFSPGGRYAAAPIGRRIKIWDVVTWTCIHTLEAHERFFSSASFSSTDDHIVSASIDCTIKLWDTATGACVRTFMADRKFDPSSLAFSSDAQYIASELSNGIIEIWHLSTETCIRSFYIGWTRWLSFDTRTNSRLYCDLGAFELDLDSDMSLAEESPRVSFQGYGISRDGEWVIKDGKPMLWLPPEHRAIHCIIKGSTVFLGCDSGRVLKLQFSESGPD